MTTNIHIPDEQVAAFCERHHIRRLWLFGSVLRDDFRPDSDIDVLAEFEPGYEPTSFAQLFEIEAELQAILQRRVDFGEYELVQHDPNYIRRDHILNSAQVIYER
jgi:predicted nucleotidyltransferase